MISVQSQKCTLILEYLFYSATLVFTLLHNNNWRGWKQNTSNRIQGETFFGYVWFWLLIKQNNHEKNAFFRANQHSQRSHNKKMKVFSKTTFFGTIFFFITPQRIKVCKKYAFRGTQCCSLEITQNSTLIYFSGQKIAEVFKCCFTLALTTISSVL